MVDASSRTEALTEQILEVRPADRAYVAFQHVVLALDVSRRMELGEPNLVCVSGALSAEEMLASIEPAQRIVIAIE